MLSVNSAIVGLYGYLQADKMPVGTAQKAIWLWAIPAAGAIVCAAWAALLASYRELNRAKFAVLAQLEADLPIPPFTRKEEIYKSNERASLSQIERWIPGASFCFMLPCWLPRHLGDPVVDGVIRILSDGLSLANEISELLHPGSSEIVMHLHRTGRPARTVPLL
jgi:hypothetical protein